MIIHYLLKYEDHIQQYIKIFFQISINLLFNF